jgi:hypothetical protein
MSTIGTARNACAASDGFLYQRRRPEKTLLYQLVSKHYPVFRQQLAEEGRIDPLEGAILGVPADSTSSRDPSE